MAKQSFTHYYVQALVEGSAKRRRTAKAKLSEQEVELAKVVLQRVYNCLQFDKDLSERGLDERLD